MRTLWIGAVACTAFLITGCATDVNSSLGKLPKRLQRSINASISQLEFSPVFPTHLPFRVAGGTTGVVFEPNHPVHQTFFVEFTDRSNTRLLEIDEANYFNHQLLTHTQGDKHITLQNGAPAIIGSMGHGAKFIEWTSQKIEFRIISGINNGTVPPTADKPDLDEQELVALANSFKS